MLSWADLEDRMVTTLVASPLGQSVTYIPQSTGIAETVRGSYDLGHLDALTESGDTVSTAFAELRVHRDAISVTPAVNDTVTVGGTTFVVGDVQREDQYVYMLRLRGAP